MRVRILLKIQVGTGAQDEGNQRNKSTTKKVGGGGGAFKLQFAHSKYQENKKVTK